MAVNMAALAALLKLQSPSNMTPTGDPYADGRKAAVLSGESGLEPSDAEATAMQNTEGLGTFHSPIAGQVTRTRDSPWSLGGGGSAVTGTSAPGGFVTSLSREAMKDTAISALKKKFGLISAQSQADIQKETAGAQVKGKYDLAGKKIESQGVDALRASEANKNNAAAGKDQREGSIFDKLLGGKGGSTDTPLSLGGTQLEPSVMASGGVSFAPVHDKALPATVSQALIGLNQFKRLGPQILTRLEQQNPGIAQNPGQFGGLVDTGEAKLKSMMYKAGMIAPPPNNLQQDEVSQLEDLAKVIGARPYMQGRPNQKVYEDIVSHLPSMASSPGANYSRVAQLLRIAPELEQAIQEVESPGYLKSLGKDGAAPPLADPYGLR